MIYGKTKEQRWEELLNTYRMFKLGIRRFAYLPTKLSNGQRIWLGWYEEKWEGDVHQFESTYFRGGDYWNFLRVRTAL